MEIQIKTTMGYRYTPPKVAVTKLYDSKCWLGWEGLGTFFHSRWGWEMVQLFWKQFLRRFHAERPRD